MPSPVGQSPASKANVLNVYVSLSVMLHLRKRVGFHHLKVCGLEPLESVWLRAGIGNVVMAGSSSLSRRVEMGVVL